MRHARRPQWASHWFILLGLAIPGSNSWLRGGILSSTSAWLSAYPIIPMLLLGGRPARAWLGAIVVTIAALAVSPTIGAWDDGYGPVGFYTFGRMVAAWFTFRMARLFERQAEEILGRLERRQAETRLLLDSSDQGFVTVDTTGTLGPEASTLLEGWLGPRPSEGTLQQWVAQVDAEAAEWLDLVFESLVEDFMPFEVCVDQLPSRICAHGRPLRLTLREMAEEGHFLAVLTDLTAEIGQEVAEEASRETAKLVGMLAADRGGVRVFVDEVGTLVGRLGDELDQTEQYRVLHTIKGNTASYGITSIARYVHEVEDRCLERRSAALPDGPFFTALPHVLRNAVDDGIETPEERMELGKPLEGTLSLTARLDGDDAVVTVQDDGKGIDWSRVEAAARSRGLPAETHQDLIAALFSDGVTTRDQATEASGRGIGTAAVLATIQQFGGIVEVETTAGQGTSFVFRAPLVQAPQESQDREVLAP